MWSLFKDKNEINEKNIIGFASFIVMTLFAIADLVTSFLFVDGKLVINEVIYNSFVWVTLGCFGISAFEKVKKQMYIYTSQIFKKSFKKIMDFSFKKLQKIKRFINWF